MATISVDVDVDLSEFDLDDLLSEIEDRYKDGDKDEREEILDLYSSFGLNNEKRYNSILDTIKMDFILENFNRISLTDLENSIK